MENKTRPSFSLNKSVYKKFSELCKDKSINMSSWIENKMKEFIDQNKKEGC